MAEVFGVVVSALTVAEMAGKFGSSVGKLKKLWDEVQDVPENMRRIMRQLEILKPVLAEIEAEYTQQSHQVHDSNAASPSREYCQQAVADLEALAEDLQHQINTAKKSRRSITKLKVTFRKDEIRGYRERIQFAMQLLNLSHQTYTVLVCSEPACLPET
ncbi:hypothetical protein CCHL11_04172 [Colletotrichum chlorophyti]|uniref:Azaphilone pigments biosynthesis cluster protein L N-terminal domain-containing protein n=1 Tax=Colletotrichum chlorophyti TaxID=708187 RepID=A0A1Q8RPG8_9PEZI|nr:hypothetical protein CCHL11_04172 [Colletotrichum chlorophyti]